MTSREPPPASPADAEEGATFLPLRGCRARVFRRRERLGRCRSHRPTGRNLVCRRGNLERTAWSHPIRRGKPPSRRRSHPRGRRTTVRSRRKQRPTGRKPGIGSRKLVLTGRSLDGSYNK
jgi:hypothetical protein